MNKALIAVAAAAAIGLGACADETGEPDVEETMQTPVTISPTQPDEATSGPAVEESAPAALDYEAIDMGAAPAEMTAPGAALALGEAAWVKFEYTPGEAEEDPDVTATPEPAESPAPTEDAEVLTSVAGISVLDIVQGDEAYWERFSNPEDFVGRVPYFVVYQQNLDPAAFPDDPARLDLWPQFADGENAEFVAVLGISRSRECEFELPDYDPATGVDVTCFIGIGEAERPITQVVYNGLDQFAVVYDETDIYVEAPLVWSAS